MTSCKFETAGNILRLQFAERGEWENCLAAEYGDASTPGRFKEWVSKRNAEFAAEIFGSISAPGDCFLGVRFRNPPPKAISQVEELVKKNASRRTPFEEGLEMLEQAAGGKLLQGRPDFLELGLLNNWNPFVPLRFWIPGEAGDPWESLQKILAQNARYLESTQTPVAFEISHSAPVHHWLGFAVSTLRENGLYVFEQALARERIMRWGLLEHMDGIKSVV